MSIDFPSAEECNTYGYSFGFECDGITHTIDQNWRIMESPDGTTFYAPVTSSLTINSDTGPAGASGQTGMTGMTGETGETGLQGPAGITVSGSPHSLGQFVSVIAPYDGEITYLNAMDENSIKFEETNGGDIVKVQSIRENVPNSNTVTANPTTLTYNHTTSGNGNNVRYDISTGKITEIKLERMSSGDYVNIIIKGIGSNPVADGFNSVFTASDGAGNNATSMGVSYAGGITYNMGTAQGDVDVFYVFCLESASQTVNLLVNHQRYHQ